MIVTARENKQLRAVVRKAESVVDEKLSYERRIYEALVCSKLLWEKLHCSNSIVFNTQLYILAV